MTDTDFIAAICRNPDDEAARNAYHDWLEERGDPRGEFIRVQCALAEPSKCPQHPHEPCADNDVGLHRCRERELLEKCWIGWGPWGPGPSWPVSLIGGWGCSNLLQTKVVSGNFVTFRRGFVESITCTLRDWCGEECRFCGGGFVQAFLPCPDCHGTGRINAHGPAIVAACPVREVWVSDRRPLEGTNVWYWSLDTGGTSTTNERYWWLPPFIFKLLASDPGLEYSILQGPSDFNRFYRSEAAAIAPLSAALLAWARSIAFKEQL